MRATFLSQYNLFQFRQSSVNINQGIVIHLNSKQNNVAYVIEAKYAGLHATPN